MNVIVINVRNRQAQEYERLFAEDELPRWRQYHAAGKFLRARFYRSEFGSEQRDDLARYVIVVEVPSAAQHSEHDSDPGFTEFNRRADELQPEDPLVFGGELIHSVG